MWFPFFETGLEQPTGRFWQTDRRERTNMHHRVDAVTTASYPIVHQQTTQASKPHLNRSIPPVWSQRARHGLSFLLYSPAQDGKHIKCFPLRAELATNLTPALSPGDPPCRHIVQSVLRACAAARLARMLLGGVGLMDLVELPPLAQMETGGRICIPRFCCDYSRSINLVLRILPSFTSILAMVGPRVPLG